MNGFSTGEEDSRGPADQICCLIDENERCRNAAGNASYSKRIQKTVTTRRLKLNIDPQVSVVHRWHKALLCIFFTWSIQKNQKHSTIYRLCGYFQAHHMYICDFHKGRIQCARTKRRRKESEEDSNETDTDLPEVDLYQLQVNTLRRYKKHHKIATRPGMNKAQLADVSKTTRY